LDPAGTVLFRAKSHLEIICKYETSIRRIKQTARFKLYGINKFEIDFSLTVSLRKTA